MDAARLTVEFALENRGSAPPRGAGRVVNGRGNGALAKIGAVREAVLRQSFLRNGEYVDQALWSIVREDWRQAKAVWGSDHSLSKQLSHLRIHIVTHWRKLTAGAALAVACLLGMAAPVAARPGDHHKLDRKLNNRADRGGSGTSRVIVTLKPGWDASGDIKKVGGGWDVASASSTARSWSYRTGC